MIRVDYSDLPAGVWAIARRDERGNLVIIVDRGLPKNLRSYAARRMRRAARRCGWAPGLLPVAFWLPAAASKPLRFAASSAVTAGIAGAIVLSPAITHQAPPSQAAPGHGRRQDSAEQIAVPRVRPAGRHRKTPAGVSVPPSLPPPGAAGPGGSTPGVGVQAGTAPLRVGRLEVPPVDVKLGVPPLPLPVQLPGLPAASVCVSLPVLGACAHITQ